MTDQELALLEQVTYINKELYKAAGIDESVHVIAEGDTVDSILENFDDEAIETLREKGKVQIDGAWTDANEWADTIEALKANEELRSLAVSSKYPKESGTATLGICFYDKNNPSKGVVAFKGTTGYDEWNDNVAGINTIETSAQLEAQQFINNIDKNITDITVVGHSKGANKAMYVTITDKSGANGTPRITKCVALDGQGLSYKFIYHYASEIYSRGKLITNYSISTDFVHVLMQQIPFSNQVYCKGYGMENAGQYHSPVSFFVQDKYGHLVTDGEGHLLFNTDVEEDTNIKMIRRFTIFVMDTSTEWELQSIADYLGPIAGEILANGTKEPQAIFNMLMKNPATLGLIVSKLYMFCELYQYNIYDITNIILTFVFPDEAMRKWVMLGVTLVTLMICPELLVQSALREAALWVLEIVRYAFMCLEVAFLASLDFIVEKLTELVDFVVEAAKAFAKWVKNAWLEFKDCLRDFRDAFKQELKDIFNKIKEIDFTDFVTFLAPYTVYGPVLLNIDIDDDVMQICSYYKSMNDSDDVVLSVLDDIFNKANEADEEYATIINSEISEIEDLMAEFESSMQMAG
jgi:hypothetical protein